MGFELWLIGTNLVPGWFLHKSLLNLRMAWRPPSEDFGNVWCLGLAQGPETEVTHSIQEAECEDLPQTLSHTGACLQNDSQSQQSLCQHLAVKCPRSDVPTQLGSPCFPGHTACGENSHSDSHKTDFSNSTPHGARKALCYQPMPPLPFWLLWMRCPAALGPCSTPRSQG